MTLRTRLLLASAVIVGVLALGAVLLLRTQQSFLTSQVDDQLQASRPLVRFPPPDLGSPPVGERPSNAPISQLYIGYVDDGELVPFLEGQLLDDTPALDLDAAALGAVTDGPPFTVEGQAGTTRFRVAVIHGSETNDARVIALPLDEVDSAVSRLRWALAGGTIAVAAILVLATWWIQRLGLRPIARLTAAADAITRGARGHRVRGGNPRTEAGKLANAFNVMLDERDATEERLRQFVADASHELRTPLTSIRGYLDLYREGGFRDDSARDDMIRRMRQESGRMHDLVEDLLLLAQLDRHRPVRRDDVDLGQILHDAATDARVLQPSRQITVDITGSAEGERVAVVGDAYRLQQVVGALVNNVLVHTGTDVDLHLTARSTAAGAEITIADDGPGLAPTDAVRIFDRFYRGDQSRTRRSGGSGLGLAIAKSIVEAHAGTIAVDTAPGAGCRFTITLPRYPATSDRTAPRDDPTISTAGDPVVADAETPI